MMRGEYYYICCAMDYMEVYTQRTLQKSIIIIIIIIIINNKGAHPDDILLHRYAEVASSHHLVASDTIDRHYTSHCHYLTGSCTYSASIYAHL